MQIKISFILPGHNVASYIAECINSITLQPIGNIEIIYVDDASTDRTLEVAQSLASRDERIKVVRHVENCGSYAARNTGLSAAKGEWVVFIDPDDVLAPNYYQQVQGVLNDAACDLVVYNYASFNDGSAYPPSGEITQVQSLPRASLLKMKSFAWLKLIRLTALKRLGLQFHAGKTMWDMLFHWQIILDCQSARYIDTKLVGYRQRSTASSYRADWYRAEGFKVIDEMRAYLIKVGKLDELSEIFYAEELNLYCDIRSAFFLNPNLEKRADEEIRKRMTLPHWDFILAGGIVPRWKCDYLLTCCRPPAIPWHSKYLLPAIRYYLLRCARKFKRTISLAAVSPAPQSANPVPTGVNPQSAK